MRVFLRCDGNPHETDLSDMAVVPNVGDVIGVEIPGSEGAPLVYEMRVSGRLFERRNLPVPSNQASDLPPILANPPTWVCVLTWKVGP